VISTNLSGTSCLNGGKLTLATSAKVAGSASGGCATFSAVDAGYKWDNTTKLSMTAQMKRTSTAKADAAAALKVLTDFKTNDLKTFIGGVSQKYPDDEYETVAKTLTLVEEVKAVTPAGAVAMTTMAVAVAAAAALF
jgi:hypothetical protein